MENKIGIDNKLPTIEDRIKYLTIMTDVRSRYGKIVGDELKYYIGYFTELGYSILEISKLMGVSTGTVSFKRAEPKEDMEMGMGGVKYIIELIEFTGVYGKIPGEYRWLAKKLINDNFMNDVGRLNSERLLKLMTEYVDRNLNVENNNGEEVYRSLILAENKAEVISLLVDKE